VREADQNLNSLLDNLVTLVTANAGDEAHAAGVVLVGRWYNPGQGQTMRDRRWRHSFRSLKPLRNIGLVWGWSAIFFGTASRG